MLRTILNLFLILIICYSASAIPITSSYFELPNLALDFKKDSTSEEISYEYSSNLNTNSIYNPTNIEFIMSGVFNKEDFKLYNNSHLIVEIFENDTLIKKYTGDKVVKSINHNENQVKYILNISKDNLSLKNGDYKLKIYCNSKTFSNVPPYEISVSYLSNAKYIGSKNSVEKGYMYLTLYFPDKQAMYLVPVSRKVPYTRSTIGATIKNLQIGPDSSLGLSEGSPIPKILGKNIKGKTAIINLSSDANVQGSAASYIAQYSFINSLTSVYGVDSVQFLVDGKKKNYFFHGVEIKEPFYSSTLPKAYLALETDTKKFLLVPVEITNQNMDTTSLIENIFYSLQNANINSYQHNYLTPTIPSNIKLIDFSLDKGILTLNFSNEFLSSYNKRNDLKKMMIDSILYSFTSIPKVNKVSIKVDGENVQSFAEINISKPMLPPEFINVEK